MYYSVLLWSLIWVGSVIATCIIASRKNLNLATYCFMSLILGPVAVFIAFLESPRAPYAQQQEIPNHASNLRSELEEIKNAFLSLQKRIARLESLLSQPSEQPSVVAPVITEAPKKVVTEPSQESFEFVFGKYWLNRIGIAVFVLGVAFFISYTFKYLNAVFQIMLGYLSAAVFLLWGSFLEKKPKYLKIAWGMLSGGWALLYLNTFAMHYIEATRLIANPLIVLFLLAVISCIAIIYNLKYNSWVVTSLTYLLAFITVGLGEFDYSTIIYCGLLSASIAYIAYRLNWYKLLLVGLCATYITHIAWLIPRLHSGFLASKTVSLPVYQFQISFGMLTLAWIIFSIPAFLLKTDNQERLKAIVAAVLTNAAFYVALGLDELYRLKPQVDFSWDIRFVFLIAITCIYFAASYLYKRLNKANLIVTDVCVAFTALAMAVVIRVPRLSVGFFWILEMALLFALGLYYRQLVYRVLASVMAVLIVMRLFVVDFMSYNYYDILGFYLKHNIAIFIFASVCFFTMGTLVWHRKIEESLMKEEVSLYKGFVVIGVLLLTFIVGKEANSRWLTLWWAIEGIAILAAGIFLQQWIYRVCALCVLSLACLRLVFMDMAGVNTVYKIAAFIILGAILLGASLVYSKYISKAR